MFAVWQNATETEVYALSLLLAVLLVVAGERAGREDGFRSRLVLAYLLGLAVAVQISALVAAPAAVYLAACPGGRVRWARVLSLGGVLLVVIGLGLVSQVLMVAGVTSVLASAVFDRDGAPWQRVVNPMLLALVALIGASATLFMLVRAAHDPGVNQGNPASWPAFVDVVARRQYVLPPLWPRRAPIWIQLGNFFQYADWQVAFGLDASVAPSWLRTPWSVLFGAVAWVGARWHWGRHRHSALAALVLFAGASLGVIAVLNLRAGPSIGVGVLPADALHESRERDYFFALAFAVAGAWAGAGALVTAGALVPRRARLGALAFLVPLLLNWPMANRRREPDASLPRVLGAELLRSSPPRAVLLLAGDNDSYTVWYQQHVNRLRADVTPVTIPLLGARWYREELARRDSLLSPREVDTWQGEGGTLRALGVHARRAGRVVTAATSVSAGTREHAAPAWVLRGMVYMDSVAVGAQVAVVDGIDQPAARGAADRIERDVPRLSRPARDATSRYVQRLLQCPRFAAATLDRVEGADSLDSQCNRK
jgi:hypothetical protein